MNSYNDQSIQESEEEREDYKREHQNTQGFKEMYKLREGEAVRFAELLDRAAE